MFKLAEEYKYYTHDQLKSLDINRIPRHVAIIMDGNRRWAKKRNLSSFSKIFTGHRAGAKNLLDIVGASKEIGIKVITVYAFSTENWSRSANEVKTLINIFEDYLVQNCKKMVDNGIKLSVIGDATPLPQSLKEKIESTKLETKDCSEIDLVIAFNYGGRDDLKRAVSAIAEDYKNKKFEKNEISEKLISDYLDTAKWPDPDLLIRTSGEMRISNFLLWQLSYSEIHVTDILWPDFSPQDLLNAIVDYQSRDRRVGL